MKFALRNLAAVAAIALSFSVPAFAEDTPFVNLVGFSNDGKYMAFQEATLMDGSGGYKSVVRVLNTETDVYERSVVNELNDGDSPSISFGKFVKQSIDSREVQKAMNAFYIDQSKGQTIHVSVAPRISSFTHGGRYASLLLRTKIVKAGDSKPEQERLETCEQFGNASVPEAGSLNGFELSAYNIQTGNEMVLHSDSRVPLSRGCPMAYSLASAFALANKVVLLVAVETQGFEGPDVNYITVPFNMGNL